MYITELYLHQSVMKCPKECQNRLTISFLCYFQLSRCSTVHYAEKAHKKNSFFHLVDYFEVNKNVFI